MTNQIKVKWTDIKMSGQKSNESNISTTAQEKPMTSMLNKKNCTEIISKMTNQIKKMEKRMTTQKMKNDMRK